MVWKEEFSRDIARVLMEQYSSVADALFELVDNPIDFRRGRRLEITVEVDKDRDLIVVEDHGGAGMDADGIAHWLRWGSGRKRRPTDISRWRVGGKAASGYLANRLVMYAKAAGGTDVWFFEDEGWSTRSEAADWGEPEPLPKDVPLPRSLVERPVEDGYVRIELSHLRQNFYNIEDLRWELSNTYRALLERGDVEISIGGQPVKPLHLPRSSRFNDVPIDLRTVSGHRVRGWVGRLDRDSVVGPSTRRRIQGGIRCLYQGRLVRAGEYFGHAGDAKGSLASLIGEVELRFVAPNLMKTDFNRGSPEWAEVHSVLKPFMAPIIREFQEAAEKRSYTREERKALRTVCEEVGEVFRRLQQDRSWSGIDHRPGPAERGEFPVDPPVPGEGGRRRSKRAQKNEREEKPNDGEARPTKPRGPITEYTLAAPEEDSVGKLIRLLDKVSGGTMNPPAILGSLDPSVRAGWRTDGQTKLVVNTDFPLYEVFRQGQAADRKGQARAGYFAETVIMKLAEPAEGEQRALADYLAEVSNLTAAWARLRQGAA